MLQMRRLTARQMKNASADGYNPNQIQRTNSVIGPISLLACSNHQGEDLALMLYYYETKSQFQVPTKSITQANS